MEGARSAAHGGGGNESTARGTTGGAGDARGATGKGMDGGHVGDGEIEGVGGAAGGEGGGRGNGGVLGGKLHADVKSSVFSEALQPLALHEATATPTRAPHESERCSELAPPANSRLSSLGGLPSSVTFTL